MADERESAQREFRIKEYEALRTEIVARLDELWTLEKFALGGAAAIAAWLFTHTDEVPAGSPGWWLPFVFLFISAGRFVAGMYHLACRKSKYVSDIEKHFLGDGGGWETWFANQSYNETFAYAAVWGAALLISLVLPHMTLPSSSNKAPERSGNESAVHAAESGAGRSAP